VEKEKKILMNPIRQQYPDGDQLSDPDVADTLTGFLAKVQDLAEKFASSHHLAPAEPAPPSPAWMEEIARGEILTTNDAAAIVGVTSTQAIRTRCEDREQKGRPIGFCFGGFRGTWLISRRLLMTDIEREDGVPARLSAESRAKKLPKFGSKQILRSETDRDLL
jgi:hypothetical protein